MTTYNSEEEISDDSSAEENSVIEQSFQRHPMKATIGSNIQEKLGKLLAALYFSLVCKILRKINRKHRIHAYSVKRITCFR